MSGIITGQDLFGELHQAQEYAHAAIKQLEPTARAKGEAEVAFWAALRNEILRLRAEGQPASVVKDLARGNERVGLLWVRFCSADGIHRATSEEIMLRKKDIDVLRDAIAREWSTQ